MGPEMMIGQLFGQSLGALAFVAVLALNMLMLARRWPSLLAALTGPAARPVQGRPAAEVIPLSARRGLPVSLIPAPARLRRAARAGPAAAFYRQGWQAGS